MFSRLKLSSPLMLVLGCGLLAICSRAEEGDTTITTTASGMKVRTTVQNSWSPGSVGVVNKLYNGAWEYHERHQGESIVVRLYRSIFLIGTADGGGHYEIAFQLPADIQPGDSVSLKPVPRTRLAKKVSETDRIAMMKDREIVALRTGNPLIGWLRRSKIAQVKVISIGETEAVIHLRLKADMNDGLDFDMDEQFTLKVNPGEPEAE